MPRARAACELTELDPANQVSCVVGGVAVRSPAHFRIRAQRD